MFKRVVFSGLTAILCAAPALAQITATIVGTVTDSSGAVVPAAAITVTNEETGLKRSVRSNDHGVYVAPALPVGAYSVTAEATGFKRKAINTLFPNPFGARLFAFLLKTGAALGLGKLARSQVLPQQLRYWFGLLPEPGTVSSVTLLERYPAIGEKRYTVALLSGCVMPTLFGATNEATVKVLRHNGCEVLVPKAQVCCGALLLHNGEKSKALSLARRNIDVFSKSDVDALIINAAGCGAMMKEYGELFKDDPDYHERAQQLTAKMKDVSEFLGDILLVAPTREVRAKVVYHDACHLAHGQNVRQQPRALLKAIPGLQIAELNESDWCCGSAGTYNLTEPELANRILERKVNNIKATETELVVAGNPGCLMQIRAGLQQRGLSIKAIHTVDLLAEAYEEA